MDTINKINVNGVDYSISTTKEWKGQVEVEEEKYFIHIDKINLFKPIKIFLYKNSYDSNPIDILTILPRMVNFEATDYYGIELVISRRTDSEFEFKTLNQVADEGTHITSFGYGNEWDGSNGDFSIYLNISAYGTSTDTILYKIYGYQNDETCPYIYYEY